MVASDNIRMYLIVRRLFLLFASYVEVSVLCLTMRIVDSRPMVSKAYFSILGSLCSILYLVKVIFNYFSVTF